MRITTALRLSTLALLLSAPLAFAGDDSVLNQAQQQNVASPYNPDQARDPVFGITYPWTVLSDD